MSVVRLTKTNVNHMFTFQKFTRNAKLAKEFNDICGKKVCLSKVHVPSIAWFTIVACAGKEEHRFLNSILV